MRPAVVLSLCLMVAASRLGLAAGVELSGPEALVWQATVDAPAARPLEAALLALGEALAGRSAWAVRLGPALLGALAVGVGGWAAGVGAALALLTLPGLALLGQLAGPTAGLVAGAVLAWAGVRHERPALLAAGWALAGLSHSAGLALPLLLALGRPELLRQRGVLRACGPVAVGLAGWAALAAGPRLLAELRPGAAGVEALLVGPLLVPVLAALLLGVRRASPAARAATAGAAGLAGAAALLGGSPPVLAAALALAALAAVERGGRWARAASLAAGAHALPVALVLVHVHHPIGDLPVDPRDPLAGGETLAGSVEAWGLDRAYTALPEDAALLRFHLDMEAGPLPPAPALPALYVRPWQASHPVPSDAAGLPRSGPHTVTAAVSTPDPQGHRVVARWQVYRLGEAAP